MSLRSHGPTGISIMSASVEESISECRWIASELALVPITNVLGLRAGMCVLFGWQERACFLMLNICIMIAQCLSRSSGSRPGKSQKSNVDPALFCKDYMEHFSCSTPALLFTFIHRTKHLDSDVVRWRAELTFELIDKCLEPKRKTMLLAEDIPCGALPASGVAIRYRTG